MKGNDKLLAGFCLVLALGVILLSNMGLLQVSADNVLGTGINVTESTADENIAVLDDTGEILILTQEINTTTHKTYINVSKINARMHNCTPYISSEVDGMCWWLKQINDSVGEVKEGQNLTAEEIWNYSMTNLSQNGFAADSTIRTLFGMNATITTINTTTKNIYTDTQYIRGVVDMINSTVNTINSTVNYIKSKVDDIYANVSYLYSRENCTQYAEPGTKCDILLDINNTVNTIEASNNLTAEEIWNFSMTNLTQRGFAQDSVSRMLEGMNGTLSTVNNTVNTINTSVNNIYANVSYLYSRENCTQYAEPGTKCDILLDINNTVNTIEASNNLTAAEVWNFSLADLSGFGANSTGVALKNTSDITGFIWERFKRVDSSVVKNETVLSWSLNSTSNITIEYNVTVPAKEGFDTTDYLPVRWKFWFINTGNDRCVNQVRQFRNVAPYCNPIIAQYVGKVGSDINVNITLRPALEVGNYTVVRELEVDPNQVWISYGRGSLGTLEVTESTADPEMTGDMSIEGDESKWNYIDQTQWDSFDPSGPVATLLTLQGRLVDPYGMPLYQGSIDVTVTNSVAELIVWDNKFDNVISDGNFELLLGAAKELSLIPDKDYRVDVTICDGPTVDLGRYHCETFTTEIEA